MLWGLFLVVIVVAGIAVLRSRKGTSTGRVDPPGVRTVAGFRGPAFVQADRAEDENPQFWGEALLKEVLARVGAPFAIGVLYSETCGHAATVEAHGHTFTVSVGFCGDDDAEWLLFVHGRRHLGPVPDADETRDLLRQLHAGLSGIEGLSEIHWADRPSFDRNEPAWQSSPLA